MIKNPIVSILVSACLATSTGLAAEIGAAAPFELHPAVERTCEVRSYGELSKSGSVEFRSTGLLPDAEGQAKIRSRDGVARIRAGFKGLDAPDVFGKVYLTYVLWAIGPDGVSRSLAELPPGSNKKVEVTSDLQRFGLFVTAEPYFAVTHPSDLVVLEDHPEGKLAERLPSSGVVCVRTGKEYYVFDRTDEEIALLLTPGRKSSLDLLQARNALRIAGLAKADRYASEEFQSAVGLTLEAENGRGNDATTAARSAVETAEQARIRAVGMARQEMAEQQGNDEPLRAAEERANLAEDMLQSRAIEEEKRRRDAERASLEAERLLIQAQVKADRFRLESERALMRAEITADLAAQDRSQDEASLAALHEARLQAERSQLEAERVKMQAEFEAERTKNEAERARIEAQARAQEAEKRSTEGRASVAEDAGVRASAEADRQQWEAERRRLEQALGAERARSAAERASMQDDLRAERARMESDRTRGETQARAQEAEQARMQDESRGSDAARLHAQREEALQAQLRDERNQMDAERRTHNEAMARLSAERSRMEVASTTRTEEAARLASGREAALRTQLVAEQTQREDDRTRFEETQRASEMETARREAEGARREAVEQDKQDLRGQLLGQLAEILNARDTDRGLSVSLSDVSFASGRYTLVPGAREQLARIAGVLVAHPDLIVEAEGHTDSVGTEAVNQALSEKRAASVRDYLVSRGIPSGSMISRGYGETQPLATNDTPGGRNQNRRVELIISGDPIEPTRVSMIGAR